MPNSLRLCSFHTLFIQIKFVCLSHSRLTSLIQILHAKLNFSILQKNNTNDIIKQPQMHWIDCCRTRSGAGQPGAGADLGAALLGRVLERHRGDGALLGERQPHAPGRLAHERRLARPTDTQHTRDARQRLHVLSALRRRELPARRALGGLQVPGVQQRRPRARTRGLR